MKTDNKYLLLIPKSIKIQMIIMISVFVCLQIAVTVVIFNGIVGKYLEDSHKKRTIGLAKTIARMPLVIEALESGETSETLQKTLIDMQEAIGARFIVVARKDGVRLAHPVKDRIGKQFVGGDQYLAVEKGETYTSTAVGTLGPSLRGFSPVKNKDGEILGFVAVGYLETSVMKVIRSAQKEPAAYFFIMLFVGLVAASMIANYVKKLTLGLEPKEIASLHREREIILNSVREGIIAVDISGRIRFANKEAGRLLNITSDIRDAHIDSILPQAYISQRMKDRSEALDEEIFAAGHMMLFNIVTVIINERPEGAVASFRRKDEMDYMNSELRQVKACSELLRVQSHEYSNKLHTISGLLQLEEYDEAKNLILSESEGYHRLVEFTDTRINCPMIAGVILGKYNRAGELKCGFHVDYDGGWQTAPAHPEHIVTVLGNLIDNAIDAAKGNKSVKPIVSVSVYENETNFLINVEDSGSGLPEEMDIFQKGVSTKSDSRGIGLYNVSMALKALSGTIKSSDSKRLGGTLFSVIIPKINRGQE
ncbi:MAG: sensor histidine kinase [Denitrovibrio sp.]|nr:MAG: sensor histidine kinase [Denitrovibrio sp.]